MNEIALDRLRDFVRAALNEWHNPKIGNTLQKIYDDTGLAPSNLRKIMKDPESKPSFVTCHRILSAIMPEKADEIVREYFPESRKGNAARKTGIRIEPGPETWFAIKLSNAEKLPVSFVNSYLGGNSEIVLDKYISNNLVTIDNGIIYTSNRFPELMDDSSIRSIGHFVLDSANTLKQSDVLVSRSFRTTPEVAERAREIIMRANTELFDLYDAQSKSTEHQESQVDLAFVLSFALI